MGVLNGIRVMGFGAISPMPSGTPVDCGFDASAIERLRGLDLGFQAEAVQ